MGRVNKILLILSICLLLTGCMGNFQKFLDKNIPEGGFKKLTIIENVAPSVAVTMEASDAVREGDSMVIGKLKYDRKIGTSSAYIEIEEFELKFPKE
jgi:hypothetical protein